MMEKQILVLDEKNSRSYHRVEEIIDAALSCLLDDLRRSYLFKAPHEQRVPWW